MRQEGFRQARAAIKFYSLMLLSIVAIAIAVMLMFVPEARAQALFAQRPDDSKAHALEIVGLAIVFLTTASALGVLFAGVWTGLRGRRRGGRR